MKKTVVLWILLVISVLCRQVCAGATSTWWIIPGESVGWVIPGKTTVKEALEKFGEKGRWDQKNHQLIYREAFGIDLLYSRENGLISSVMITAPSKGNVEYKTKENVAVGSPLVDMAKAYGKPTKYEKVGRFELLTYEKGDSFTTFIGINNRAVMIWLGKKTDYTKNIQRLRKSLTDTKT